MPRPPVPEPEAVPTPDPVCDPEVPEAATVPVDPGSGIVLLPPGLGVPVPRPPDPVPEEVTSPDPVCVPEPVAVPGAPVPMELDCDVAVLLPPGPGTPVPRPPVSGSEIIPVPEVVCDSVCAEPVKVPEVAPVPADPDCGIVVLLLPGPGIAVPRPEVPA